MESREYQELPHKFNQGIVDGRPEGAPQPSAPILSDTVIDKDAGADTPTINASAFRGPESSVTSKDVHKGFGHPGSGMSSKEARHDGKSQVRKSEGQGSSQWGPPGLKKRELDRAQRTTGDNVGPTSPI